MPDAIDRLMSAVLECLKDNAGNVRQPDVAAIVKRFADAGYGHELSVFLDALRPKS